MTFRISKIVVACLLGAVSLAIGTSCDEPIEITPCKQIPDGGCPKRGDACSDPTCDALYVCTEEGQWRLVQTCGPHDASVSETSVREAGPPPDASFIDVPGAGGGPGCEDLEAPDCSLALAGACSSGCCGCEDVFVCRNGGWDLVYTCANASH